MKRIVYALLLMVTSHVTAQLTVKPEVLPQKPVSNTYFETTLNDPYQYLEDLNDPTVITWMKDNTNYSTSVLNNISGKQELFNRMKSLIERQSASISFLNIADDGTYYYVKRVPGEEIGKLYKRKGYKGKETLFFDPTQYKKEEGKIYTISDISPNIKGDKIAVSISANGSENPDILIFKNTGEQYKETLELASDVSWDLSGERFFYIKLNSADIKDVNRQIYISNYIHNVGTSQSEDQTYFSKADYATLNVDKAEYPLVIYIEETDKNILLPLSVDKDLKAFVSEPNVKAKWKPLLKKEDNVIMVDANETDLYLLTYNNAPNYKIVRLSNSNPVFSEAKTVVKESKDEIITNFELTKEGMYYATVKNGVEAHVYFLRHNSTSSEELKLPFTAGRADLSARGSKFSEIWVNLSGWTSPDKRYLYNPETKTFVFQPLSTPVEYPELENLIAKEVMVKSHDGVMVPVSIIYNKNMKMNGENSAVIYSYGAYGISTEPFFSPITLAYATYGGVLVVPHVRGGGELGDAWHKAGQKLNKPNTWKDGIAAAEYVIDQGYTNPNKLSIFGGSAGGIFVGRAITERPDLFVAASPMVGAMNTVRMEESPNGPVNTPEFGTVSDPEEFKGLLEMDSYHHLKAGTDYPAMLITAGMNDPRVIAWEPSKFAAKMQHDNSGEAPILLQVNFEGGHGGRTTLTQRLNDFSNLFSFFYWQSGHPDFQAKEPLKN
ncbi:S9 family peptidase [Formosa sediminum]|uniref:prolyl oligopeptidase n=1 Tax=Formosa sediminum TaxID=2594004 RepID=A0A516GS34_9FLAO|nr:prolyl oligopeptidase family serine peptidase [Formosa sediminum]QDO94326.1 S9 family peptidase [Formosa sediminum]